MTDILLAHGSRHPRAAEGLEELRAAVTFRTGRPTRVAYLDLQQPLLADVARPGDTVVPLLFTDAFHTRHDVPAATAGLGVRVTAPLGLGDDIAAVLRPRVQPGAVLYAVGSSMPGANQDVARLAAQLGTDVAFATCSPRYSSGSGPVIPLFVTYGLLLDRVPGAQPLAAELAPVVAHRILHR
ncbi:CbiX [Corynebacterium kalinowskii]|uniref:CbiX n=1 Tax=Corynebacterium kalinowskii TaxID=2675216 RepID=A0A6B8VBF2_9CORY|nr:CbiX/SirB N-terminal domain-containing protein [Corynebacterium kalinowskii]QGU01503.1 CbiX [Corynebacterium kalinowskii]